MICQSCRKAGELNAYSNKGFAEDVTDRLITEAAAKHKQCRGGTWCDCQHQTGKWLQ